MFVFALRTVLAALLLLILRNVWCWNQNNLATRFLIGIPTTYKWQLHITFCKMMSVIYSAKLNFLRITLILNSILMPFTMLWRYQNLNYLSIFCFTVNYLCIKGISEFGRSYIYSNITSITYRLFGLRNFRQNFITPFISLILFILIYKFKYRNPEKLYCLLLIKIVV